MRALTLFLLRCCWPPFCVLNDDEQRRPKWVLPAKSAVKTITLFLLLTVSGWAQFPMFSNTFSNDAPKTLACLPDYWYVYPYSNASVTVTGVGTVVVWDWRSNQVASGSLSVTVPMTNTGHYFAQDDGDRTMFMVRRSGDSTNGLDFGTTAGTVSDTDGQKTRLRLLGDSARRLKARWDLCETSDGTFDFEDVTNQLNWVVYSNNLTAVVIIQQNCPSWFSVVSNQYFAYWARFASNLFVQTAPQIATGKVMFEILNEADYVGTGAIPDSRQSGSFFESNWPTAVTIMTTAAVQQATLQGLDPTFIGHGAASFNANLKDTLGKWDADGTFAALDGLSWHRYDDVQTNANIDFPYDTGSNKSGLVWMVTLARSYANIGNKPIYITEEGVGGQSAIGIAYANQDRVGYERAAWRAVKLEAIGRALNVQFYPHLGGSPSATNSYEGIPGWEYNTKGVSPTMAARLFTLGLLEGCTVTASSLTNATVLRTVNVTLTNGQPMTIAWATEGNTTNVAAFGNVCTDEFGNSVTYGGALTEQPRFFTSSNLILVPVEP